MEKLLKNWKFYLALIAILLFSLIIIGKINQESILNKNEKIELIISSTRINENSEFDFNNVSDSGKEVADKIAKAYGANLLETEIKNYPWISVRVFEGETSRGDHIIIEVDKDKNSIFSLGTYGSYPTLNKISREDAYNSALKFIDIYINEISLIDLDEFELQIEEPTYSSSIAIYKITWQEIAPSGAILPKSVEVYIDAETGEVTGFFHFDIHTTIDTNPNISKQEAVNKIKNIEAFSSLKFINDQVYLAVIYVDDVDNYMLGWIIPFVLDYAVTMDQGESILVVDAKNGELMGVNEENKLFNLSKEKLSEISLSSETTVVISLDKVEVPDLMFMSLDEANRMLEDLDLKFNPKSSEEFYCEDGVSTGSIIYQYPSSGTIVEVGTEIITDSCIEKGQPQKFSVPDVKGMHINDAIQLIEDSGLEVNATIGNYPKCKDSLIVVSQNPSTNTEVIINSTVELAYCADIISLPNYIGLNINTARNHIKELNMDLSVSIGDPVQCDFGPWEEKIIGDQSPKSGAEINRGSSVNLFLCEEPILNCNWETEILGIWIFTGETPYRFSKFFSNGTVDTGETEYQSTQHTLYLNKFVSGTYQCVTNNKILITINGNGFLRRVEFSSDRKIMSLVDPSTNEVATQWQRTELVYGE